MTPTTVVTPAAETLETRTPAMAVTLTAEGSLAVGMR
jgi:hypothetical protein